MIFGPPGRPTAAKALPSGPTTIVGAMLCAIRLPGAGEFGLPGVRSNRDIPWFITRPRPSITTAEPNRYPSVAVIDTTFPAASAVRTLTVCGRLGAPPGLG